jgi:ketosteroid isomerase-like protein
MPMTTTRASVAAWLDRYVKAWRTYDPAAIGELFSSDAVYAYHPWDEPVRGREAIVADWLEDRDEPDSWSASYEPLAIDGDLAVVTGRSRYVNPDGSLRTEYWNLWVLRFDQDGRCTEYTEWFMEPSGGAGAAGAGG